MMMKEQEIKILDDADLQDIAGGGFGGGFGGGLYAGSRLFKKLTFGIKYIVGFSPNASGDPRIKHIYYGDLKCMGPIGPRGSS